MLSTRVKALSLLIINPVLAFSQLDSVRTNQRIRITPLPVVYYSPETRFGFGALVAANFETVKIPDTITKSSYAQTYFLYTVNKQYDWGTSTRIYGPQNDFIFSGKFNYTHFPEFYYGIATEDPESKKDSIEYNRLSTDLRFFWKINKYIYTGFSARFNKVRDVDAGTFGHFNDDKPLAIRVIGKLVLHPRL